MPDEYEIIVAFGAYSVGARIRPNAMLRNQLLYRKWIRKVEPEPVLVAVAEAVESQPPAIVEPPKQKRGRRSRMNHGDATE